MERALYSAQDLGLLGPAPVNLHVHHAEGFLRIIGSAQPGGLLDLGAGVGVPGLLLAVMLPTTRVVLLDSNLRRTGFLSATVDELGLGPRVEVLRERAEVAGRSPEWREAFSVVVARAFGPPATTAECGSSFVRPNGILVVSAPPRARDEEDLTNSPAPISPATDRWPTKGLATLGLLPRRAVVSAGYNFQILDKVSPCSDRYPRRTGLPAHRPLF